MELGQEIAEEPEAQGLGCHQNKVRQNAGTVSHSVGCFVPVRQTSQAHPQPWAASIDNEDHNSRHMSCVSACHHKHLSWEKGLD